MAADQIPPSPSFVSELIAHGGWLTTAVLAVIGWFTRMAMGRHFKALDKFTETVEEMGKTMNKIDTRLSKIEGRFEQQDHQK